VADFVAKVGCCRSGRRPFIR